MEDPRWEDYIKAVRCGDNPTLTWRQYVLAQRVSAGLATLLALGYRSYDSFFYPKIIVS